MSRSYVFLRNPIFGHHSPKTTTTIGDLNSPKTTTTTGDQQPTMGDLHSHKSTTTTSDSQTTTGDLHNPTSTTTHCDPSSLKSTTTTGDLQTTTVDFHSLMSATIYFIFAKKFHFNLSNLWEHYPTVLLFVFTPFLKIFKFSLPENSSNSRAGTQECKGVSTF